MAPHCTQYMYCTWCTNTINSLYKIWYTPQSTPSLQIHISKEIYQINVCELLLGTPQNRDQTFTVCGGYTPICCSKRVGMHKQAVTKECTVIFSTKTVYHLCMNYGFLQWTNDSVMPKRRPGKSLHWSRDVKGRSRSVWKRYWVFWGDSLNTVKIQCMRGR